MQTDDDELREERAELAAHLVDDGTIAELRIDPEFDPNSSVEWTRYGICDECGLVETDSGCDECGCWVCSDCMPKHEAHEAEWSERRAAAMAREASGWNIDGLAQFVREAWINYCRETGDTKPSHLTPWEELSEWDKEADRRIATALLDVILRAVAI